MLFAIGKMEPDVLVSGADVLSTRAIINVRGYRLSSYPRLFALPIKLIKLGAVTALPTDKKLHAKSYMPWLN